MQHFRFIALLLLLIATPASAFDWAGKIQQDLQDLRSPNSRVRRLAVERLGAYSGKEAKRYLIKALSDLDPSVQRSAAKIVADRGYREAVPVLLRWLSSWDDSMRIAAASALGKLGDHRVIKTLVRALNDPEQKVRLKIIAALGKIGGKKSVMPLIGRLRDTSTKVRKATIEVLGSAKDRRAVLPLIRRLSDSAREVRVAAVHALGAIGDNRAAIALARTLRDPSPEVVDATIATLGKLKHSGTTEALIDLLQTGPTKHRAKAASALGGLGTPTALKALARALHSPSLRPMAQQALTHAGKKAAEMVASLLRDPRSPRSVAIAAVEIARDGAQRAVVPALIEQLQLGRLPKPLVIRALGRIRDPRAQRPLLELLESSNHDVRIDSLKAVGRILDERAAEPLLRTLSDPVKKIRFIGVRYLGRLRQRIAVKPLLRLVKGRDRDLARAAARAVASIADPRAINELFWMLRQSDRQLRQTAIYGIARTGFVNTKATDRLVQMCKQNSGAVRIACIQALGAMLRGRSHDPALQLLSQVLRSNDHSALHATIYALAGMRDSRIPDLLINRLDSLDEPAARQIASVLGNFTNSRESTLPTLLRLLKHAKAQSVRGAAAWSLGKLTDARAAKALQRAVQQKGWALKINATAALARLPGRTHLPTLRALANDKDPHVRANAILGLGQQRDKESLSSIVDHLHSDRSPWVRLNALRALRRIRPREVVLGDKRFKSMKKVTSWIGGSDPDSRVRATVRDLLNPPRKAGNWIGLYLLGRDRKMIRAKRFLLITPSGRIKATFSDRRGQSWEEGLAAGRCFVELPPPTFGGKPPQ